MAQKLIVIGANGTGLSCAMEASRKFANFNITVFDKSKYISYGACSMPYVLNDMVEDYTKIFARSKEFFEKKGIDIRIETEVINIKLNEKKVEYKDKSGKIEEMSYDKLMIATGSKSRKLPFEKENQKNVFHFTKMEDLLMVKKYMKDNDVKNITVIGGGYIGAEVADSLSDTGRKVTLVEMFEILSVFDEDIKLPLREVLAKKENLTIIEGKGIKDLIWNSDIVKSVLLEDKSEIQTDMVIVSAGVLPETTLAEKAGLRLGESKAIQVNKKGQTSVHNVFAGGDCAEIYHSVLDKFVYIPLGTNANRTGKIIGRNFEVCCKEVAICGTSMLEIAGLQMASTGISEKLAKKLNLNYVTKMKDYHLKPGYFSNDKIWIKMIVEKYTSKILGCQMIGHSEVHGKINNVATMIHNKMRITDVESIDMGYHPIMSTVWDPLILIARKF
ncbi:MAG: FAD-dependent oxidoreductase [Candidatus Muirbacterium halophilum]|nr:FAD-dependent oxidoreductase [Candidatus Muirbacterium halophilum]